MSHNAAPLLFSFRRCPFAIRARLAIHFAELNVERFEVSLKAKPPQLLAISAKATVPTMQLHNGQVLDQSLDIMRYALEKHDPLGLLASSQITEKWALIDQCDTAFKPKLDRYKYADRHPELSQIAHRQAALFFIQQLQDRLQHTVQLFADTPCIADIAIMPFIRQFAQVDRTWFNRSDYQDLRRWLEQWLEHPAFVAVMAKEANTNSQH